MKKQLQGSDVPAVLRTGSPGVSNSEVTGQAWDEELDKDITCKLFVHSEIGSDIHPNSIWYSITQYAAAQNASSNSGYYLNCHQKMLDFTRKPNTNCVLHMLENIYVSLETIDTWTWLFGWHRHFELNDLYTIPCRMRDPVEVRKCRSGNSLSRTKISNSQNLPICKC